MNKIDFDSVGRWLSAKGFIDVNVNETEIPRWIAASWGVFFGSHLVARCHDYGDGACVSVYWKGPSHKESLAAAGRVINQYEPVETALVVLSLIAD